MKVSRLPLSRLVLGTLAGISLSATLLVQPSWAIPNSNNVDPLQDLQPQQNTNPFSRNGQADSLGMLDLIRRAGQGSSRSVGDYSTEQNQNLDAATAQFRARQLQQIQGQKQGTPANSGTRP